MVQNTFDIVQKIENFIPAHTLCINGRPLTNTSRLFIEDFITSSTYTPVLSFFIDTQYIDGTLVYTTLRRYIPEFRDHITYDEKFAQISLLIPYEQIVGFETLWNEWLLYLANIKLENWKTAA